MRRRGRIVVALTIVVAGLLPSAASAHAYLVKTVPAASVVLNVPPPKRPADLRRSGRATARDRLGDQPRRSSIRPTDEEILVTRSGANRPPRKSRRAWKRLVGFQPVAPVVANRPPIVSFTLHDHHLTTPCTVKATS